jgi:hypothetical protein
MHALRDILLNMNISMPQLIDYEVHIPPGGRTDALVETRITWDGGLVTRGVDSDQVKAAVIATEKMLNIWLEALMKMVICAGNWKPSLTIWPLLKMSKPMKQS